MQDAAELGQSIAAHPDDLEAALAKYEQALFPRTAAIEAGDEDIYEVMLGDDAPNSMIRLFTGAADATVRLAKVRA
jgi:2-polyprenyl-6-methoxyphenol hydroxylase-like FAD-dependent oxidoreductase